MTVAIPGFSHGIRRPTGGGIAFLIEESYKMIDFIAEIAGGIVELVIDLLIEPQIDKLREKRKQKKKSEKI